MKGKRKDRKRDRFFTKDDITGYLFNLPFLIGVIFLFIKPMATSIVYSFNRITVGGGGIELTPIGWDNYKYALFSDASFVKALIGSLTDSWWSILLTTFFSMFLALLLNGKFTGRLLFRCIMFLPVIFGTSVVFTLLEKKGGMESDLAATTNAFVAVGDGATRFLNELISSFGLPDDVMGLVRSGANSLFDLAWSSGIQIVLFIIGLQAIPSYLYEVSKIEGATQWETFWKITFPLLSPTMLLCLIYTIIRAFNGSSMIEMVEENMRTQVHYASAQTWLYTLVVFLYVFVVYYVVSKKTIYLD
ncbi:MAG: sugar ABC transporter permease [Lachnospiraceae bacterium]|nr:sugar ABC transporter permease [Lachnospiraceae bacterium]